MDKHRKMVSAASLLLLNHVTGGLFAPGLNAISYPGRAMAFLSELLPSDLNALGALDNTTGALDAQFDHHPPGLENALTAYGHLMHKYAPFRFDPEVNSGKPYSIRDFYAQPALHDLDIFQEVHQPMGFKDQCYVHVPGEKEATVFFGMFRDSCYSAEEKELLTLAQPHLVNARRLAMAQSEVLDPELEPGAFTAFGYSVRESETLHLMLQGKTNHEIAAALHLRMDTVSAYIRSIYIKMGVSNRVEAVLYALSLLRSHPERQRVVAFEVPTGRGKSRAGAA